ncbi:MAG: twin-arginine translocation signal domain-containing protein [Acidobacteriia bacterium]|nr:twin-arginine translocation signal domain-containing protein [Terriglobia bacterium]
MPISNSRRGFLKAGTALAASLARAQNAPAPASEIQVPKMKFGNAEISRMVLGVNPFYGFAHYNDTLATVMKEWYTPERVCDVMRRCTRYGVNAFNYVHLDRGPKDWAKFVDEGGKMHLIPQVTAGVDPAMLVKTFKPLGLQRQGEVVDKAWQTGEMDSVKEWCKQVRDLGVLVGVGTHKPEVIDFVESAGWDVDFYAGCVYNRTRTSDEWKKALGGEMMEMPSDIYMQSDPARMYKAIRQTKKPCFAFKILAAGRISGRGIERAFRTAFESIKPIDGVYVGMFPRIKDEVRENAQIVQRILARS